LERAVLHICDHARKLTGMLRAALAGGVALNCTANGRLMRSGLFDEIHVQPAAGDDGVALGAALYRPAIAGDARNALLSPPLFVPSHSTGQIESDLELFSECVDVMHFPTTAEACAKAARLIADGKVIAWHRGRMEYGPRALGNRSILADPGHPEMRDRIN